MSRTVFKWLCKRASAIMPALILLIVINSALAAIGVRFTLISKEAVDIAANQADGLLSRTFIKLGILMVVQICLLSVGSVLDIVVRGRFEIRIKKELFGKLMKKNWLELSGGYHSGELLNRLTSDVGVVIGGVCEIIPQFVSLAVTISLSAYYLFMLAPVFALYILPLMPIVLILGRFYSRKIKRLHKKCQESEGNVRSFMQEMLQNIVAVKAFGAEDDVTDHSSLLQKVLYRYKVNKNTIAVFASIGLYIIFTFGYYAALAWGAIQISADALTYGSLVAILGLVSRIQSPLRSVSSVFSKTVAAFASAERIIELENLKEEKKTIDYSDFYGKINRVCLDNVSFAYGEPEVINGASAQMNIGEFIAITGNSGGGKSTLLKLLLGLAQPSDGSIYLEGDGKKIPVSPDTRSFFSYVPQDNMILSGTIRDNICFYKDCSDEEIKRAATVACADEFISELPNGYDTKLTEGGGGLSGGQVQRIAIARAMLSDAKVILLDEATSALDEDTEKRVLVNLKNLTDKSCIIVSHRAAALEICDKVVAVENSRLYQR